MQADRHRRASALLASAALLTGVLALLPAAARADRSSSRGPTAGRGLDAGVPVHLDPIGAGRTPRAAPVASGAPRPARPTMDPAAYASAKDEARRGSSAKPGLPRSVGPNAVFPLSQTGPNFVGDSQGGPGGGWVPPDAHGAVGNQQYTEVTNSDITAWSLNTSPPSQIFHVSLNAFVGNSPSSPYVDPRIIYHPIHNRWIVIAPALPESAGTVQKFSVTVTKSPNIGAGRCTYTVDTTDLFGDATSFEYAMLGFDHDAINVTGNVFDQVFETAAVQFWPLAELTSCLPLTFFTFDDLDGTVAATNVWDRDNRTHLLSAQGSVVTDHVFRDTSKTPYLETTTTFDIIDFQTPPDAPQHPGNEDLVDTLDGRFQNASAQIGTLIYNTHAVRFGSFAAVKWYRLDHSSTAVANQCYVFASPTSHDFNPSLFANADGDVFLNWSVTKADAARNILARAGGVEAVPDGDCPEFTQLSYGSGQEYGDADSTVEIMPWGGSSQVWPKFNRDRVFMVNQLVSPSGGTGQGSTWTSKIAEVRMG